MIKCVSYNCNSIRNNSEIVKLLLGANDIVCLQELMLLKSDLPYLNCLDENFDHIACVADRESEGIVEGRPKKGVAIFWRKSLSCKITPIKIDDSCIAIKISNGLEDVILFDVYLPCDKQTPDALHEYRDFLGKLTCLISEQDVNKVVITCDFNADPYRAVFGRN